MAISFDCIEFWYWNYTQSDYSPVLHSWKFWARDLFAIRRYMYDVFCMAKIENFRISRNPGFSQKLTILCAKEACNHSKSARNRFSLEFCVSIVHTKKFLAQKHAYFWNFQDFPPICMFPANIDFHIQKALELSIAETSGAVITHKASTDGFYFPVKFQPQNSPQSEDMTDFGGSYISCRSYS